MHLYFQGDMGKEGELSGWCWRRFGVGNQRLKARRIALNVE